MRFICTVVLTLAVAVGAQAADTFKIDPAHTTVAFTISHLVISEVNGRFDDVVGEITIDKDAVTAAKTTIQTKSIDTAIKKRDDHLRSPDFFDAEKFPTITFEGAKVEKNQITGSFTLHGVTKEITFPFKLKGPIKDPWGGTRLAISAETTINRIDYGMKSFPGVGDDVSIRISAEATKAEAEKK